MNKFLLTAAVAFANVAAVMAQPEAIQKIINESETNPQAFHYLDELATRFGGRILGSDAYENSLEWIAYQYKKWGVDVYIEECGELPFGFNRDAWFGRILGGENINFTNLHFVTPSYTSGTHGCQRGHVVSEPHTLEELKKMKGLLKGAWVLVDGQSTGFPIGHSHKNDSIREHAKEANLEIAARNRQKMMEARRTRTTPELESYEVAPALFYDEMVEAGVLGFVQSAPVPLRALYDRAMLDEHIVTDFDSLPTVPDIKLDENQFAVIKKMVDERRSIELEFDIRNHFKLGPVKYFNLVGEIKGTEFPDEYVLFGAHLDSYDASTGAVDDGTGTGPLMETARLIALSGAKPKRTIRFLSFCGEEFGLWGSLGYCKRHEQELDKVSNMFNRDSGIEPPVGMSVPESMYEDFVAVCQPLVEYNDPKFPAFTVQVNKNPRVQPKALGGSDDSTFGMHGVPIINFVVDDVFGTNFNYQEIWHTERDILNKQVPEYQQRTALVQAIVGLGVANLDHQLTRENIWGEAPAPAATKAKGKKK